MKYSILSLALQVIIFSTSAWANNCPLNDEMTAPLAPRGYTISSIKKDPKNSQSEIVELIPQKGNINGVKQYWKVLKSTSGKVVEIETIETIPTKDQLDYINSIKNDELTEQARIVDKNGDSLNFSFKKAENFPVKIGGKISMDFNGKDCFVNEINEKFFDQGSKSILNKPVFVSNHCADIESFHAKAEKTLLECENKFATYSNGLSSILNSDKIGKYVGGGEGGGGSSPVARTIASADVPSGSINIRNFLVNSSNPFFKELYKSKELCDMLAPKKVERANSGPSNGSSGNYSNQQ